MRYGLLVLNAGSSSIKFALFEVGGHGPCLVLRGQVGGIGVRPSFEATGAGGEPLHRPAAIAGIDDHTAALGHILDWLAARGDGVELQGVGHRVVHGGVGRVRPARVDAGLLAELEPLVPLAPHHQPHNLAAIRAVAERAPALPQVACFDTAFHATQPPVARRLPLPRELVGTGLRRYGFHGLSYEHVVDELRRRDPAGVLPPRAIIAHLGNGASLCAVREGRSVATTMGFSTLDGLVMGTRCGSIDPGVLLHLMREQGLGEPELTDLLYNRSGLLGLSGISSDMRTLLASDATAAREAVESFCYSIARHVASLATDLEGLDALVFTGGIGEHAAPVREQVCERLRWLGLRLDAAANRAGAQRIEHGDSAVAVWVVSTDEELIIARHTARLLGAPGTEPVSD